MRVLVTLLLLVSLAANATLWMRSKERSAASSTPLTNETQTAAAVSPSAAGQPRRPDHAVEAATPMGLDWNALPTGDLTLLASHLKERGFPPHIVRGIVSYYLDREYHPRRQALQEQGGIVPYWKQSSYTSTTANQRAELRALYREQTDRLNAITGTSPETFDEAVRQAMSHRYGALPAATLQMVQSIEQDYSELTQEIRNESQGMMFASDREKLALLEEERRKDLLSVLTPEQFEEFELRTSQTSNTLRRSLAVMKPTAAEFRTLHRLQQAFDEKYSSMYVRRTDPAYMQERQAAERELIAAAKAELGAERGSEYEKSRDFNYVHAHTVAQQLNLPKESGDRLWQLQKNAFEEFNRAGSAPGMNTEQRSQARLEYLKTVKASIIAEIGEANLPTYQNGAGGWLTSMEQMALRGAGGTTQRTVPPVR